jgi:hypothetical protein
MWEVLQRGFHNGGQMRGPPIVAHKYVPEGFFPMGVQVVWSPKGGPQTGFPQGVPRCWFPRGVPPIMPTGCPAQDAPGFPQGVFPQGGPTRGVPQGGPQLRFPMWSPNGSPPSRVCQGRFTRDSLKCVPPMGSTNLSLTRGFPRGFHLSSPVVWLPSGVP